MTTQTTQTRQPYKLAKLPQMSELGLYMQPLTGADASTLDEGVVGDRWECYRHPADQITYPVVECNGVRYVANPVDGVGYYLIRERDWHPAHEQGMEHLGAPAPEDPAAKSLRDAINYFSKPHTGGWMPKQRYHDYAMPIQRCPRCGAEMEQVNFAHTCPRCGHWEE